jgi:wnt family.
MLLSSSDKDYAVTWIVVWKRLTAGWDVAKDGKISWTARNWTPIIQIMVSPPHSQKKSHAEDFSLLWAAPCPELYIGTNIYENPAGCIFRVVLENQTRIFSESFYPCNNVHDAVPLQTAISFNTAVKTSKLANQTLDVNFSSRNLCVVMAVSRVSSGELEHSLLVATGTVCKTFPGLSKEQLDLCRRYPDVTTSAIQGLQLAVDECQYQFQWHRWNCSSLNTKNRNPHSSVLLQKGK